MTAPTAPVTVCIGTYGDERWSDLVRDRAMPSVVRQTWLPEVHWCHDRTLHEARNHAAENATTEWLCFLDADDELDSHYIEAMCAVARHHNGPTLIQPATLGVYPDGREDDHPIMIPPKPLLEANFMVIGTLIRRDQFADLGGFHDWPVYEDWDLWIRAWRSGAQILRCVDAIYRVMVTPDGRNNGSRAEQLATYHAIRARHLAPTGTARG